MTDLVVIVPSRGRPDSPRELFRAFRNTCYAETDLVIAVDADDPTLPQYRRVIAEHTFAMESPWGVRRNWMTITVSSGSPSTMVSALNAAAREMVGRESPPEAIAFMGDDHRPSSSRWDEAYMDALRAKPGFVYGNDLLQGSNLPTQIAMSASVVRVLGHMAPPSLTHLYVDNYWLTLGKAADCITYLPDVVIEHLHPVAGKAAMDEGYVRVNAPEMYERDAAAFAAYLRDNLAREVELVRAAVAGVNA